MLNGKASIIFLTIGLIKKKNYKWGNIFFNQNIWGECKNWITFI